MFSINDITWYIESVPRNHFTLRRSDGSFALASCDNNTKTIYISNKVERKDLKKILCHEITHAAMFSYGVELSYDSEELLADLIATYGQEIIDITNDIFKRLKKV